MPSSLIGIHIVFILLLAAMLAMKYLRKQWFNRMGNQVWKECLLPHGDKPEPPAEPSSAASPSNVLNFPPLGGKKPQTKPIRRRLTEAQLYWEGREKLNYMAEALKETRNVREIELTLWLAVPVCSFFACIYAPAEEPLKLFYLMSVLFAFKPLFASMVGEGAMLYTLDTLRLLEKKYPIAHYGFVKERILLSLRR